VNLVGLQDTEDDITKIWHIDENNDLVLLEELGELTQLLIAKSATLRPDASSQLR